MTIKDRCLECRFCVPSADHPGKNLCCRYPLIVIEHESGWPVIPHPENSWCGEWGLGAEYIEIPAPGEE